MSEEQGQGPTHRIVSDSGGSIEFLATVTAEANVLTETVITAKTIEVDPDRETAGAAS